MVSAIQLTLVGAKENIVAEKRKRGKAFGEPLGRRREGVQGRPGNRPVEQQERPASEVEKTRRSQIAVSGPGAADFLTASGGMDRPGAGAGKGTALQDSGGSLFDRQTPCLPRRHAAPHRDELIEPLPLKQARGN